jgi:uncharacterized protein YecT (DUF1311 family)
MNLKSLFCVAICCAAASRWLPPKTNAAERKWPEGFELLDGSASPNGRYGLLVPKSGDDADSDSEENKDTNYIVDLNAHRVLGEIPEGTYAHLRNRQTWVVWSKNSQFATASFSYRAGIDTVLAWQFSGSGFKQEMIDGPVRKALEGVTKGQKHSINRLPIYFYTRVSDDGKTVMRAFASTEPFEEESSKDTHASFFQGTYDMKLGRWIGESARVVSQENYQTMDAAYDNEDSHGNETTSDDERAKILDDRMNEVYAGLRLLLPAKRFEQIKEEQKTWLVKRDAAGSIKEKNKLVEARIKALDEYLW